MTEICLTRDQKLDLYYWMRLTRTLDEMAVALWKQGRGVGGIFVLGPARFCALSEPKKFPSRGDCRPNFIFSFPIVLVF